MNKIISIEKAKKIVKENRLNGLKTVNVHGCFDMLHYGHVIYFEEAKKQGHVLLVSITPDRFVSKGPNRPFFDENARLKYVSSLEIVDFVVLNDEPDAINFLKTVAPDITARGSEYINLEEDITGKIRLEKKAIEDVGGRMIFTDGEVYSSTKMINNLGAGLNIEQLAYRNCLRKAISLSDVETSIKQLQNLSVLVIGDVILDEYTYCSCLGTVSKHSAISALYHDTELMSGGILAIKRHISKFSKCSELMSIIGGKNLDQCLRVNSNELQIDKLCLDPGAYTPHKRRFIATGYPNSISKMLNSDHSDHDVDTSNRLFEVSYLPTDGFSKEVKLDFVSAIEKRIKNYDIIVVADFGHGVIDKDLAYLIAENAKYLALNVQTNSANFGFNLFTKFPRTDFLCIDELELRLAFSDRVSDLHSLMSKASQTLQCSKVMVTRGRNGIVYLIDGDIKSGPALANNVTDPVGAGDAVLSIASLVSYNDNKGDLTLFSGIIAGMIGTSIRGNSSSIQKDHLIKNMRGFVQV